MSEAIRIRVRDRCLYLVYRERNVISLRRAVVRTSCCQGLFTARYMHTHSAVMGFSLVEGCAP